MSTGAHIKGHPLHSMLVTVPVGLWVFSLVADILRRTTENPAWDVVAFYTMGGGIVGALLAAGPGLVDLLSIRDPQTRQIGIRHMVTNLAAVGLFVVNFLLRLNGEEGGLPFALSLAGVVLIGVAGWLGGEMVYVRGVAVRAAGSAPPHVERRDEPRFIPAQSTKHQAR